MRKSSDAERDNVTRDFPVGLRVVEKLTGVVSYEALGHAPLESAQIWSEVCIVLLLDDS